MWPLPAIPITLPEQKAPYNAQYAIQTENTLNNLHISIIKTKYCLAPPLLGQLHTFKAGELNLISSGMNLR